MTNYRFAQGARVRLRDVITSPALYGGMACFGNEGWITARRKDKFNLPEVYVQWDKRHWTYNGAPDCWTFEDHFDLVEDNMASKQDKAQELANAFANGIASLFSGETPDAPNTPNTPNAPDTTNKYQLTDPAEAPDTDESGASKRREYVEAVQFATEKMGNSEAFILVGIDRESHPASPDGVLVPFALGFGMTDDAEILAAAQMAQVAGKAHQGLALRIITDNHE